MSNRIPAGRLGKMRRCIDLLPDPGPEVCRELFAHIDAIEAEAAAWRRRAELAEAGSAGLYPEAG